MLVIRFRPSSHSTDYTVVATCENSEIARKLCAKFKRKIKQSLRNEYLDWEFPEAVVRANRALFTVHTNTEDSIEDIRELAEQEAEQTDLREDYQELKITVKAPAGSNLKTLPLLFSSKEAELILRLTKLCGRPQIKNEKSNVTILFDYKGNWIYDQERNEFLFDGDKTFKPGKRWKIGLIYDSRGRWIRERLKLRKTRGRLSRRV